MPRQPARGGRENSQQAILGTLEPLTAKKGAPSATDGSSGAECGSTALRVSVPMPPSTNRLYATVQGRRVKTREAREYAELVSTRVWLWKRLRGDPPEPPYRLTIVLHPATRRRIDISNSIKCLEDGLFSGLERNDREVVEVVARLGERDPLDPRAEVTLEHIDEQPRRALDVRLEPAGEDRG